MHNLHRSLTDAMKLMFERKTSKSNMRVLFWGLRRGCCEPFSKVTRARDTGRGGDSLSPVAILQRLHL